jgi:phage terminase Nu1 subunit (DNA packaging protein)
VAVEIVTKAELSRLLGLSRARVTQYANMGMPVLSDGKLDLAACVDWLLISRGIPGHGVAVSSTQNQ